MNDKLKAAHDKLQQAVADIVSGETWQKMLRSHRSFTATASTTTSEDASDPSRRLVWSAGWAEKVCFSFPLVRRRGRAHLVHHRGPRRLAEVLLVVLSIQA